MDEFAADLATAVGRVRGLRADDRSTSYSTLE
jgi:hypothetical protein